MKKAFFALLMLTVCQTALASKFALLIYNLPRSEFPKMEQEIKRQVSASSGMRMDGLKIDWAKARCIETPSDMNADDSLGVCTVPFGMLQVSGDAAVVLQTDDAYSISIINYEIE